MNVNLNFPAIADLIKTMDQHRIGASLFVIFMLILAIVLVAYLITK